MACTEGKMQQGRAVPKQKWLGLSWITYRHYMWIVPGLERNYSLES